MRKSYFFYLMILLSLQGLHALTGGNIYRVMMTRDNEPVRLVFVRSLKETNPETFLVEQLGYRGTGIARQRDKTIFYEKRDRGRVPVLCFHRLGEDDRYELSVNRTHHLLAVMARDGFFPLSDADFASGDFSSVPSGLKPFVIGADDAASGQVLFTGEALAKLALNLPAGDDPLDPNCLASIFSRYFPRIDGHYNFTFYVSFDAVPFRQTGGIPHNGAPYRGMPVVAEKFTLLRENYILGHHTVTHTYLGNQTAESLVAEIAEAEDIFSGYLSAEPHLNTMAYPYGLAELRPDQEMVFTRANERGGFPDYAFDLDGELSVLPWDRNFQPYRISRISVDNQSFDNLLSLLERRDIYTARRTVLLYAPNKEIDLKSYNLTIGGDDLIYVYIP